MTTSSAAAGRRRYNSARRSRQAAQTRADVLHAAVGLFAERGWAATTLAAVAGRAEVAVETVYAGFGSKKGLLRAAIDVAVVGDTVDVPLYDRPAFRRLGQGTRRERVEAAAALVAEIHERSARVWRAVVEAASADAEVDGWRAQLEAGRRVDVGRGLELALGEPLDERLVDLMWALYGPEVYLKLVGEVGMSRTDYERCLVDATLGVAGG